MGKVSRVQKKRQQSKGGGGVKKDRKGKGDKGGYHAKKEKHTWKSVRNKKTAKEEVEPNDEDNKVVVKSQSSSQRNKESSLRSRMLERLSVARFRSLNADIDSTPSSSQTPNPLSHKETFKSYHTGFTNASSLWKQNPVDLIADWIVKTIPKNQVIADFGCGTGKLATLIPNKTHSFDLHALEDHVTECDMKNVPLPNGAVHVVVFCLSLMGLDVTEYIVEAKRVLAAGGKLKIVEANVRVQGDHLRRFVGGMRDVGFKKVGGVEEVGGVFSILEFKKDGGGGGQGVRQRRKGKVVLGPCVYKKR